VFRTLNGSQGNLHCYILVSHKTVAEVKNVNSSITCSVCPTIPENICICKKFWGRRLWSDLHANCAKNSYKFYTHISEASLQSVKKAWR